MTATSAVSANGVPTDDPSFVPKLAAGILLYRRAPDRAVPEVLLVLPRSARTLASGPRSWSIPKGKPLPNERLIDTARREFEEETARPAPRGLVELGEIVEASGKRVAVWAAHEEWSAAMDSSNGRRLDAEIAEVGWFDADQAVHLLRPGQTALLDRLDRLMRQAPPTTD